MRRLVLPLCLFTLFLSSLTAQEHPSLTPALLTLHKDGTVIHVFGSIHVGSPEMYPLPDVVEEAFRESDRLVVELDALEVSAVQAAVVMKKKLGYPRGDSLANHVNAETFTALQNTLKEYGLPPAAVTSFRPAVADMLLTQMVAGRAGYDGQQGIDVHFLEAAKEMKKPIIALETMEEQFDALSRIPDDAQTLMLTRSLADLPSLSSDLEKLMNVWKQGDLEECYKIEEKDLIDYPGLKPVYDILIAERNRTMAARLRELVSGGGTYFVVAGVGHFVGPDSVIELLRRDGYVVEGR